MSAKTRNKRGTFALNTKASQAPPNDWDDEKLSYFTNQVVGIRPNRRQHEV